MKKKNILIVVGVVVCLCITFFAIGSVVLNTPEGQATSTALAAARATEDAQPPGTSPPTDTPPTATPPTFAPPIEEILDTVDGMTDAQRNKYNDLLRGNLVENWSGTVIDVDEGELFGGFTVYVDMVDSQIGSEVHIKVTEEVALSLNKGQTITFSGEIDSVSDFLGTTVYIENATIGTTE